MQGVLKYYFMGLYSESMVPFPNRGFMVLGSDSGFNSQIQFKISKSRVHGSKSGSIWFLTHELKGSDYF